MEKLLITGGNGFLARWLVAHLAGKYSILLTSSGPSRWNSEASGVEYSELDIRDAAETTELITRESPDIIIHTAAISKPDECELNQQKAVDINITGTQNLLRASVAANNPFFIFLSTDFVFDGIKGMYAEDDQPAPVNFYGESKWTAEKLVAAYKGSCCIVRTVLLYGEPAGARDNLLTNAARSLKQGKPIRIVNDQVRTPTYVEDLCRGINAIITKKASGIFHIAGKDVLTPYEMVITMARYLKLNEDLVTPVSCKTFTEPAKRPLITCLNISKAVKELGYDPLSFEDGLRLTFSGSEREY